jgi:catechol 2,3-dioxygenase-like lactoylglutathione lyase family enzyme|tara:strand:- start:2150 stop:2551 length:402 start_codon:yes stop_codon:yes gene_type:complete
MSDTNGVNHIGLSVFDLDKSVSFFVDQLGWEESGRDETYPRSAVSDGQVRLTLWQVDHNLDIQPFDRRQNIGLHHLALEVSSEEMLHKVHSRLASNPSISIEFEPELLGVGPRKHMMCREPGGIRIEFIWLGN